MTICQFVDLHIRERNGTVLLPVDQKYGNSTCKASMSQNILHYYMVWYSLAEKFPTLSRKYSHLNIDSFVEKVALRL